MARIGCTPYTAPAYGQTCVRTLPLLSSPSSSFSLFTYRKSHYKILFFFLFFLFFFFLSFLSANFDFLIFILFYFFMYIFCFCFHLLCLIFSGLLQTGYTRFFSLFFLVCFLRSFFLFDLICLRELCPYAYAVVNSTTRNWAQLTSKPPPPPKVLGEGGYGRIPKGFCPLFDFGEEGRPSHDFSYFPYLFYHRFLVSNCSKFCVKRMGSTVRCLTVRITVREHAL